MTVSWTFHSPLCCSRVGSCQLICIIFYPSQVFVCFCSVLHYFYYFKTENKNSESPFGERQQSNESVSFNTHIWLTDGAECYELTQPSVLFFFKYLNQYSGVCLHSGQAISYHTYHMVMRVDFINNENNKNKYDFCHYRVGSTIAPNLFLFLIPKKARARNPKNPINQQPTTTYEFHKQILIFRVFYWRPHSQLCFVLTPCFVVLPTPRHPHRATKTLLFALKNLIIKTELSLARYSASRLRLLSSSAAGGKRRIPCYGRWKNLWKKYIFIFSPLFHIFTFFQPWRWNDEWWIAIFLRLLWALMMSKSLKFSPFFFAYSHSIRSSLTLIKRILWRLIFWWLKKSGWDFSHVNKLTQGECVLRNDLHTELWTHICWKVKGREIIIKP